MWEETVLHRFGVARDGTNPVAGLLLKNQVLYGTTLNGGNNDAGVVFSLDRSGETILYSFSGQGTDGANPAGGVIFDRQGEFAGTTTQGGDEDVGTVFTLTPSGDLWQHTTIHNFHQFQDGYDPMDGLIMSDDGTLYATTAKGGRSLDGVVFSMSRNETDWNFTTLYSFDPHGNDGIFSTASLILGSTGLLYGTTAFGGGHNSESNGTVFSLTLDGAETLLYSFTGGVDGSAPMSGVVMDGAGNIYGTTSAGGKFGQGVIFKLTPQRDGAYRETVLHHFTGQADGGTPMGGLLLYHGALYGTTSAGGQSSHGVVFKIE